MGLNRRDFLKVAASGGLAVAANLHPLPVLARDPVPRLPEALGMLYDATLCIGCKACMSACKRYNHLPQDYSTPDSAWDNPLDLSAKTFNIVKLYKNGAGQAKAKVGPEALHSTIGRHAARAVRTVVLYDELDKQWQGLMDNIGKGDFKT